MLQKLILIFTLCWALAGHAATPAMSNQYQHLNNSWNAPNTTYPNCTTAVKTNCLNTYSYTATDPIGGVSIATVPNGGVAAGSPVAYQWGPGGFLYCGTWTVSAVANYLDSTGATVSASPDTTTTAVPCPLVASPVTGMVSNPAP